MLPCSPSDGTDDTIRQMADGPTDSRTASASGEPAGPGDEAPPSRAPAEAIAFDLYCPDCGYNLRSLTSDRCPECGCATKSLGKEECEMSP